MAKIRIPKLLDKYSGGKTELNFSGRTVRELLENVKTEFPNLYGCICDDTGRLRQHVNIFVNDELLIDRVHFASQISDSDVVNIFQSVSGG